MQANDHPAWTDLREHHAKVRDVHMRDLFADDPGRAERFRYRLGDLLVDASKHRITEQSFQLLLRLAEQQQLGEWIDRLFQGAPANSSEQRPALHTALRAPAGLRAVAGLSLCGHASAAGHLLPHRG